MCIRDRLQGAQSAIRNPPTARRCCNPPPIRNPPCGKHNIASGVRTWNCAGTSAASNWSPKLPRGALCS
eukprot:845625-Alexandrium_andersonii.AAC.1